MPTSTAGGPVSPRIRPRFKRLQKIIIHVDPFEINKVIRVREDVKTDWRNAVMVEGYVSQRVEAVEESTLKLGDVIINRLQYLHAAPSCCWCNRSAVGRVDYDSNSARLTSTDDTHTDTGTSVSGVLLICNDVSRSLSSSSDSSNSNALYKRLAFIFRPPQSITNDLSLRCWQVHICGQLIADFAVKVTASRVHNTNTNDHAILLSTAENTIENADL